MVADTFIRRPILASVCSLVIIIGGADRDSEPADRPVPAIGAAHRAGRRVLSGSERRGGGVGRHHSDRTGPERRRGPAVHDLVEQQRWHRQHHHHLRRDPQHRRRRRRCAESRVAGRRTAAERGQDRRHFGDQERQRHRARRRGVLRQRRVRRAVPQQLRRSVHQGRDPARPRRVGRAGLRRAQVRDAAVARSGSSRRPGHHRQRGRGRAARAERAGGGGTGRRPAGPARPDLPDQRPRRRPAHRARRVRQHHPEAGERRDAGAPEGCRAHRARRGKLLDGASLQRPRCPRLRRHAAADRQHPGGLHRRHRRARSPGQALPARPESRTGVRHDTGGL